MIASRDILNLGCYTTFGRELLEWLSIWTQAKHELSKENVMVAWCVWLGQGECDMPLGIIKTHLLHHMVSIKLLL